MLERLKLSFPLCFGSDEKEASRTAHHPATEPSLFLLLLLFFYPFPFFPVSSCLLYLVVSPKSLCSPQIIFGTRSSKPIKAVLGGVKVYGERSCSRREKEKEHLIFTRTAGVGNPPEGGIWSPKEASRAHASSPPALLAPDLSEVEELLVLPEVFMTKVSAGRMPHSCSHRACLPLGFEEGCHAVHKALPTHQEMRRAWGPDLDSLHSCQFLSSWRERLELRIHVTLLIKISSSSNVPALFLPYHLPKASRLESCLLSDCKSQHSGWLSLLLAIIQMNAN